MVCRPKFSATTAIFTHRMPPNPQEKSKVEMQANIQSLAQHFRNAVKVSSPVGDTFVVQPQASDFERLAESAAKTLLSENPLIHLVIPPGMGSAEQVQQFIRSVGNSIPRFFPN